MLHRGTNFRTKNIVIPNSEFEKCRHDGTNDGTNDAKILNT